MSIITTRRRFIEIMPITGVALITACSPKNEPAAPAATNATPAAPATAPTPAPAPAAPTTTNLPMLDEKDPMALALGYVDDASRADKDKFKNFVDGSLCSNCAQYLGQAGDAAGGCKIFPGKNVTAKGWCSAWAKMA